MRNRMLPKGKLRVTASTMFGTMQVMPLISEFLQMNKKVEVDLLLLDRNVNLIDEGVDVAIRIGELADSSMVARNVGHVRRVICGTPELVSTLGTIASPEDLTQIPCVRFTGLSHGNQWQLYENNKVHTIPVAGPDHL